MRSNILAILVAGSMALTLSACSAESSDTTEGGDATPAADTAGEKATETACVCDAGKAGEATWCEDCSKGYVDGAVATECAGCFAEKTGGAVCEECAAKKKDGG